MCGPHTAISKQRSDELSWSKLEHHLSAKFSPGIVVERAERGAVEGVLNIARIVVVENGEDGATGAQVQFLIPYVRREWSCDLNVSRLETREALRTTRTHVIAILILGRVREPGVHIVDGQDS